MNASYAVLEVVTFSGFFIPVLDMPMKEDIKRIKPDIPEDLLKKAESMKMTQKQREIWRLYASGHKRLEIAKELDRSPQTVYKTVALIIKKLSGKPPEGNCPHSPCCFGCPLPDCVLGAGRAVNVNVLPSDRIGRYSK